MEGQSKEEESCGRSLYDVDTVSAVEADLLRILELQTNGFIFFNLTFGFCSWWRMKRNKRQALKCHLGSVHHHLTLCAFWSSFSSVIPVLLHFSLKKNRVNANQRVNIILSWLLKIKLKILTSWNQWEFPSQRRVITHQWGTSASASLSSS